MKKTLFLISNLIISLGVLYISGGCSQHYYAPNLNQTPFLDSKGDIRLSIGGNIGDQIEGVDVQGGYALKDNIGLVANGFYTKATGNDPRHGWIAEAGIGTFGNLGTYGKWEVYGGLGEGRVANQRLIDGGLTGLYFTRAYIQPAIGFHHKNFDAAFSVRAFGLLYGKFTYPDTTQTPYYFETIERIAKRPFVGAEPCLMLRGGTRNVKIQAHFGISYHTIPATTSRVQAGLGLQFMLNQDMFSSIKN